MTKARAFTLAMLAAILIVIYAMVAPHLPGQQSCDPHSPLPWLQCEGRF